MPKSLADGKIKVTLLASPPANPSAPTVAELTAGVDIQCNLLKSDFRLSATASDTVADSELCSDTNATTFGASNYEGNLTAFRYYDETGAINATEDVAYDAAREKGTHLHLAVRQNGRQHDTAWTAAEEGDYFHVITDTPQMPSDMAGFIKRTIPLGVQGHSPFVVAGP